MNYRKILEHLYSLESPKIRLGLERIQKLLDKIENPERKLRCIHVAGTNGKGSVCAMLYYILKEAGYKVGLYTSPHLKKFNERIRVDENLISDRGIVEYYLQLKPHITDQSFFEITTALAFLCFYEKKVDFAILEVGLGGRLDATNVIKPLISVITNIGLEHTQLLGSTIEKIAFEKAGIIKNNVPIVTGERGKALNVIKKIAKQKNAPLFIARKHGHVKFKYLNGKFQQKNKDIAVTAMGVLAKSNNLNISKSKITKGLEQTNWPGRLEFISKKVLLDCAHNPSGFEMLKEELEILKKERKIKNLIFVIGMQKDKDISNMLVIISPLASTILFTKSKNEKAEDPTKLLSAFQKINKGKKVKHKIFADPKEALYHAKKITGKNDLVVIAGSIYLAGDLI